MPATLPGAIKDGHYDGQAAAKYANENKEDAEQYPDNDCANFVSYALEAGGLVQKPGVWEPGSLDSNWTNAPKLYNMLLCVGFTESTQFESTPYVPDDETDYKNFLELRKHNAETAANEHAVNQSWVDFIASIDPQPGDLVFYFDHEHFDDWSHVAMVYNSADSAVDPETNLSSSIENSIAEPSIIDHSGPKEIPSSDLPRSMGDTKNTYIKFVRILYAP